MANIDVPIVAGRYSDEGHDHAYVTFLGEHAERLISKQDHPAVWSEAHRSVVFRHYEPKAVRTLPTSTPVDVLAAPAIDPPVQALTVIQPQSTQLMIQDPQTQQLIARLEARIAELERRPASGGQIDLDTIASNLGTALDIKLAEMRRALAGEQDKRTDDLRKTIVTDHEERIHELETILIRIVEQIEHKSAA